MKSIECLKNCKSNSKSQRHTSDHILNFEIEKTSLEKTRNHCVDILLLFLSSCKKIQIKIIQRTGKPSFWMIRAVRRAARFASSVVFAPVQTIFPEWKINTVVLGFLILMITALKRFGLYSAFLARSVMSFSWSLQPTQNVATIFLFFVDKRRRD